jgi:hypothetical protein
MNACIWKVVVNTSGPKFRLVVAICVMLGRAVNIWGRWYKGKIDTAVPAAFLDERIQ